MKEIIIQGTPRPIHFGLRAIDEFVKQRGAEFGQTVASTDALGSLDSIVALTATGLNEGARRADSDRRYTEDEVWTSSTRNRRSSSPSRNSSSRASRR